MNKPLQNIFCLLLIVEAFSLWKVVEMLEAVVSWQEVRWIWRMRQNAIAQFVQHLKHWLYNTWSDVLMEKNWAHSVDQCWLQALQFLVHLVNLQNILLRCNGFTGIQKAVVDQIGRRPPNSDLDLFLVQVWLWEVLWRFFFFFWSSHWAGHCQLYKIRFLSHVTRWLRNGSLLLHRIRGHLKTTFFFFLWPAHETSTYQAFSPFHLLQINGGAWQATVLRVAKSRTWLRWLSTHAHMPNDSRMVDDEFLGNFSHSCKLWWWLSIGRCHLPMVATALVIFKALISFALISLEPPLHWGFVSSSWAKCVDIASCFYCFMTHFELE